MVAPILFHNIYLKVQRCILKILYVIKNHRIHLKDIYCSYSIPFLVSVLGEIMSAADRFKFLLYYLLCVKLLMSNRPRFPLYYLHYETSS